MDSDRNEQLKNLAWNKQPLLHLDCYLGWVLPSMWPVRASHLWSCKNGLKENGHSFPCIARDSMHYFRSSKKSDDSNHALAVVCQSHTHCASQFSSRAFFSFHLRNQAHLWLFTCVDSRSTILKWKVSPAGHWVHREITLHLPITWLVDIQKMMNWESWDGVCILVYFYEACEKESAAYKYCTTLPMRGQ